MKMYYGTSKLKRMSVLNKLLKWVMYLCPFIHFSIQNPVFSPRTLQKLKVWKILIEKKTKNRFENENKWKKNHGRRKNKGKNGMWFTIKKKTKIFYKLEQKIKKNPRENSRTFKK